MTKIDFTTDSITAEAYKDRVHIELLMAKQLIAKQLTPDDARTLAEALNECADKADEYDGPDADKNEGL